MPEIVEELELEDYVQRRIWIADNIGADQVTWRRQGLVTVQGRATWRWRFLRSKDALLFRLRWC